MKRKYIKPFSMAIEMEPFTLLNNTITKKVGGVGSSGKQFDETSTNGSSTGNTHQYHSQFGEQVGEEGASYFGEGSLLDN